MTDAELQKLFAEARALDRRGIVKYVSYEIITARYNGTRFIFSGPDATQQATKLWTQVHRNEGASFRGTDDRGRTFGTKRGNEHHGVNGVMTEVCQECGVEFIAPFVADPICPGCDVIEIPRIGALRAPWWNRVD